MTTRKPIVIENKKHLMEWEWQESIFPMMHKAGMSQVRQDVTIQKIHIYQRKSTGNLCGSDKSEGAEYEPLSVDVNLSNTTESSK